MKFRRYYDVVLARMLGGTFTLWQRLGFHITPNHFFQPIPDTRSLGDHLWERPSELVGVCVDGAAQVELLTSLVREFGSEFEAFPYHKPSGAAEFYLDNPSYRAVDAELLYGMVRKFKPRRIYEIGSGFSTLLSAQAIRKNQEQDSTYTCEFVVFDPFPHPMLRNGLPGLTRVVGQRVQDVAFSEFSKLVENDVLFIDSSHVLTIGSDVQWLYLDVLPRINRNVLVHVHDVFLPREYPRDWIFRKRWFWNEQYLLQAFLTFNDRFEILWAGSYMHLNHPGELEKAFLSYNRTSVWPGSFWMKRVG